LQKFGYWVNSACFIISYTVIELAFFYYPTSTATEMEIGGVIFLSSLFNLFKLYAIVILVPLMFLLTHYSMTLTFKDKSGDKYKDSISSKLMHGPKSKVE